MLDLPEQLRAIVGRRHVLTTKRAMQRYCRGFRSGEGEALAVVRPGSLVEQWQVLRACVAADVVIIFQAANTGLTEGSTPNGIYDRNAVVISTTRMDKIHMLKQGHQVVSLPGATLFDLEKQLDRIGRQPHSVIGSSCIGASIMGGVCNNSGGSLVERGPSYTEMSLFARINENGQVELVNHLGLSLGDDPETILDRVDRGDFADTDIIPSNAKGSDTDYAARVRDVEADTPARWNADPRQLHESSGCAGKLAVFAVRLDTYPQYEREQVFYIGTKDTANLTRLRQDILRSFELLPVSGEYMHAEAYDISKKYGKDTALLIDKLGTDRLPLIFALKGWFDARLNALPLIPKNLMDRLMQGLMGLLPNLLPKRLEAFRQRFDHHLILKMRDGGVDEAEAWLKANFDGESADWFACSPREGKIAGLNRFAAAGAAVRYMAVNENKVADIIALDIALRRNDENWFEILPPEIDQKLEVRLYYGHFFCHVLHQDYVVKAGHDPQKIKSEMLKILDKRGAKYPAEHNVGHLYKAEKPLQDHYRKCDPTNSLNPGIGKMSKRKHYAERSD